MKRYFYEIAEENYSNQEAYAFDTLYEAINYADKDINHYTSNEFKKIDSAKVFYTKVDEEIYKDTKKIYPDNNYYNTIAIYDALNARKAKELENTSKNYELEEDEYE